MSRTGPAAFQGPAALEGLAGAVRRILELQRADGAIPWVDAGVVDPWNHAECAMALAVAGENMAARRAFEFLADAQNEDGSWWGDYGNAAPLDDGLSKMAPPKDPPLKDTNHAAYPAVALWRIYRLGAKRALAAYAPMVLRAVDFVLSLQSPHGEVRWAAPEGDASGRDDALLTGNASIHKSLDCAAAIAREIGDAERFQRIAAARARLGAALRERPDRFDRTWESKRRYAMDWYYPALSDALSPPQARARLLSRWAAFTGDGHGCRCVVDEPWVTAAETCELALACLKVGWPGAARALLASADRLTDRDGAYWMGFNYVEGVHWPADKPSWTAAAAILAHDAYARAAPGWDVLIAPQALKPHAAEGQGI